LIKSKELIISPKVSGKSVASFLSQIKQEGISTIYADPKNVGKYRDGFNIIYPSDEADSVVCKDINTISKVKHSGKLAGFYIKVMGKKDEDKIVQAASNGADFVIVDARNWYESKIGRFKNAVTPGITHFREWTKVVESLKDYKDKKIVTYCTGGIRCEKASAYMVKEGFKDVYQLDGGIINFINKYPDTYWQGSMFVFDDRKVVEPNTKEELKYVAECEFCGKPTSYYINCHNIDCDRIIIVCHDCKIDNDYCCSDECRRADNKRDKYYG